MYKNQLQELAQRSCFNLPSYSCIREGPDHSPRFKATVNFNGETFESPTFCSTLRQAEHVAAEVALNALAKRGPSRALAARVLDETGVYKNLLQETAHRAGLNLPAYSTVKSGPGHVPAYSCTVELAGISFSGEPARTKKQAQKNAAMAAWSSLKRLAHRDSSSSSSMETKGNEEQEQVIIARILKSLRPSQAKNSTQNERRRGQQRCIPITNRSSQTAASLYPTQFPSWLYPSYSPELAMYQLWQQQELLQQQNCLLALPVLPSIPSIPQMFPFMHSVLRPNHCLHFSGMEKELTSARPRISIGNSGPSIYASDHIVPNLNRCRSTTTGPSIFVSDHMIPNLNRCRSTVTIQEIQEDKREESPESTFITSDPFVIGKNDTELRIQESVPEDEKQSIGKEGRKIVNIKSEGDRIEQLELKQARIMDSCHPIDFRLQNLGTSSTSPRQQYPPPKVNSQRSLRPLIPASPVMIRNVMPASSMGSTLQNFSIRGPASTNIRPGTPSCSARTMPRRTEFGGARNSFMAPAVRIRSVVPVCSAPPPRKLSGSSQEGGLPNIEKDKNKDDASKANSDLSKLHI